MSWIETISYAASKGKLRRLYDRIKGHDNRVDNILRAHSLRPHTLEGHMVLYKNTLHHAGNQIPKWMLETLGVYVSRLNGCGYCVDHHTVGLGRLLKHNERFQTIQTALETETFAGCFTQAEQAMLTYARRLTLTPDTLAEVDVIAMREAGLTDGEILEVNQVVSYFAYANRTVLGLGVTIQGDILGLSPSNVTDEKNWNHQ